MNAYNNYSNALAGLLDDDDSSYADFGSLAQSVSGMQAENYASIAAFQAEQADARRAATEAAGLAYEAAVKSSDAGFSVANSQAETDFYSQSNQDELEYLSGESTDYQTYLNAVKTAQTEYDAEQCRLLGLLQDSVDTGYNTVSSGTSSLDVQVCFVAGTPVLMADESNKAIEKIIIGDRVKAAKQDDPAGEVGDYEVVEVYERTVSETLKLSFDSLTTQCTREHPFFVYEKGWVQAGSLQIGDVCRSASGKTMLLKEIETVPGEVKVYNFQVKEAHTYFVGTSRQDSVLVHNTCYDCYYERGLHPPCYVGEDIPCVRHGGTPDGDLSGIIGSGIQGASGVIEVAIGVTLLAPSYGVSSYLVADGASRTAGAVDYATGGVICKQVNLATGCEFGSLDLIGEGYSEWSKNLTGSELPGMVARELVPIGITGAATYNPSITYGSHTQGPLIPAQANTFRGGSYQAITLRNDIILYRVHGGGAKEAGRFFTTARPKGPLQAQMDLALLPEWGNTAQSVTAFRIPAGVKIYVGKVAPQEHLLGGSVQVFIPNPSPLWVVD